MSFEEVVLKGLATDGGRYIPEAIPDASSSWQSWKDLSYPELALEILSLYISPSEIPRADLKDVVDRSYSTFRSKDTTPLVHLQDKQYLLELFHGPTFAFKDVALQFLGNLFEYFLVRKNKGKTGKGAFVCLLPRLHATLDARARHLSRPTQHVRYAQSPACELTSHQTDIT